MAQNYLQEGTHIEVTTTGNTLSNRRLGDGLVISGLFGVVVSKDPDNSRRGVLATRGVFSLPKATGSNNDFALGELVRWNSSNNRAVPGNSGKVIGVAVKAAAVAASTVEVLLMPQPD